MVLTLELYDGDSWVDKTNKCTRLRHSVSSRELESIEFELIGEHVDIDQRIRVKRNNNIVFEGIIYERSRRRGRGKLVSVRATAYPYLILYDRHMVYRLYQAGMKAGEIIRDLGKLLDDEVPINLNGIEDGDSLLSPWKIENRSALEVMKSVARGTNYWLRMKPCLSYLNFDGQTGYGVVSSDPSLDLQTPIIEALVRIHGSFSGTGRIFHRRGSTTSWSLDPYQLAVRNAEYFQLIIGDGSTYNALDFGSCQLNTWYHVVGVVTGSQLLGYVNGELKKSKSQTITPYTVTDDAQFASSHPWRHEPFDVALIRVYDYNQISVSVDDLVSHNLENLMNPITDGLVLWLNAHKLENGTVPDLSGNGNSGTVYGGVSQLYEVYPQYANSMLLEFKPKVIA